MVMRKMKNGLIGVNTSSVPGLYLVQVTEMLMTEALQARAILDENQFRELIAQMQSLLPENKPCKQNEST